jgi:TolB-like protein/AraC-like DNA-binding protein/Tfp pilus assembly protein PilF
MQRLPNSDNTFLARITSIVEEHLSNEQFGVSELAHEMNMSRSNLLRKVNKLTKLSVSKFIRQVRLKKAMETLKHGAFNVSEISHKVGFSSTSYFIKCFREYYGYPPGEVGKRSEIVISPVSNDQQVTANSDLKSWNWKNLVAGAFLFIAIVAGVWGYFTSLSTTESLIEKSIAVLPFKNDSSDSSNLYLINGLMESTLNNLQKIKDLRVISRTSTEKYRNTSKSIPEMAKELDVNYFVEGSGQKIGNQILLNIQLIDASGDRHLWARQYRREAKDIFELQQEIAKNIAEEVRAIITQEERQQIEKIPTEDLEAYDSFLKGQNLLNQGGHENLENAIIYFKRAIERDREFALAYAKAAISYFYLDIFQKEKKYIEQIGSYADRALLFDAKLPESLSAKAVFYLHKKEYEQALPYLEKALEYNPNDVTIIHFLSDFYANFIPNTSKYLEYSLMGARLDIGAKDSISKSYTYLHLGNALIQTGFIDEAVKFIDKSTAFYPQNPYSNYVKAWILLARDRDFNQTRNLLIEELNKDTTRIDILQDVAKIHYLMKDYDSAWHYYRKFIELRERLKMDIYKHESLKIAIVMEKVGMKEKSEEYVRIFKEYADNDRSIYKHASLASYYAYRGDVEKSIQHLKLFSEEDNVQYWILFMRIDPEIDPIKHHPEFNKTMMAIETRFWHTHNESRAVLEEQGLL